MKKKPPISDSHAATRQALIETAGEIFAEVGFRAATVRQISQRAGANIAAINYHFGDKEKLYLEVLRFAQTQALAKYPLDHGVSENSPPKLKLKAFVRSFLLRIFDQGPLAWHARLMARELIDPTPALDTLVAEKMLPQSQQLTAIIADLLSTNPNDELVRRCGMSVISQVLFYHHCRPVVVRLFPQMKFTPAEIEKLADHITEFSLGGLGKMSRKGRK